MIREKDQHPDSVIKDMNRVDDVNSMMLDAIKAVLAVLD